jgi:hypothetical protein
MAVDGKGLGTPARTSREQAKADAHRANRRSGVCSLGVVFFELVAGEPHFRGNVRVLLQHVIHDDDLRPRWLQANVPRDLETICLKCLEKGRRSRYGVLFPSGKLPN